MKRDRYETAGRCCPFSIDGVDEGSIPMLTVQVG